MHEVEHAKSLFVMANKDFKAIRGMLDIDDFDEEFLVFMRSRRLRKHSKSGLRY